MSWERHQTTLMRLFFQILLYQYILLQVFLSADALRSTDPYGAQHRLDPNSGIAVRMTVTYEVPLLIEPVPPINAFGSSDFAGPPYREIPSHVSHVRSTGTEITDSVQRGGGSIAVATTRTPEPERPTFFRGSNNRSNSPTSTCSLPDQCINTEDCAPGGVYRSCGPEKMCCQPRVPPLSGTGTSSNSRTRDPSSKGPVPTKASVSRGSAVQGAFDEGLPAAFHGYLLLSEHPRMPPSAPNTGTGNARSVLPGKEGVSPTKAVGRTKPDPVISPERQSGRYGGPPIRLGTPGTTPLSNLKQKEIDLLPNDETCGPIYLDSRITKGKDAQIGQFPWMALLGFKTPPATAVNFICAGSLISDRYVLTAAHCFTNQNILVEVRLGEFDLSKDPDGTRDIPVPPVKKEEAEEIIIHPNFSRSQLSNDIALIRLKNRLRKYIDTIKPICLPLDVTFKGMNYTIAGWGKTDYSHSNGSNIIQMTTVSVLNHTDCLKRAAPYNLPVTADQICAGGNQGHDVCSGDSGGPLTKIDNANNPSAQSLNYIVGIVSFGSDMPCGTAGLPSVYTKVTSYLSWILENLRS